MEPDLDRLLDFEVGGGLFPQFAPTWESCYRMALGAKDRALATAVDRPRIAFKIADPQFFSALFVALCRSEVDLFLFNPTWGRREEEAALDISKPHLILTDEQLGRLSIREFARPSVGQSAQGVANRLRVMIATGGTSGRIRFAVHDWSTLAAATYGFQQHMNCNRMASHCVLPLYHVSGFMQLVRALLTMGVVVYGRLDTFRENHQRLVSAESHDRFLSLVPTQLERLIRDERSIHLLREYRAIFVGGGPAPIGLLEDCREQGIPLAPTYGMTETAAQVATLLPERFLAGNTSQGKALPHVRIDIVAEDNVERPVPKGERGLTRVAGSSLFKGYYGDAFKGEGRTIVTSDLGMIGEGGYLYIFGRADRVIISGGEKINLREVELCLESSNLTRDVVAFGVADAEWGRKLAVAYVPKETFVSEAALKEAVKAELAGFKFPKVWQRCERIPRNEAGKPLLDELRSVVS